MESLAQFLNYMNEIDYRYVVLRNWDGLPHNVQVGAHSDLDLLVYDFDHFLEVYGDKIKPVYPLPRVQYKIPIKDSYVLCDVRHVGDDYYPYDFQQNILNNRVWNKAGFWTPDPVHHQIALGYHAVHHKGYIDPTYRRWLGDVTVEKMFEALKESSIGWVPPDDPTVGQHNKYLKGATGVVSVEAESVKKKQYRFKQHNLIYNEYHMLNALESVHFPRAIDCEDSEIEIEDCGTPLTPNNLPEDWREQLVRIVQELKQADITHRDIRIENLMIKNKTIKLIDFGWARKSGDPEGNIPDLLGFPNKAPWGYDDAYSMGKVIKQIQSKLENK